MDKRGGVGKDSTPQDGCAMFARNTPLSPFLSGLRLTASVNESARQCNAPSGYSFKQLSKRRAAGLAFVIEAVFPCKPIERV